MKIIVLNGPNINFTGKRETNIYGTKSYEEINDDLYQYAKELDMDIEIFQTNSEGQIIDELQRVDNEKYFGVIINPGAYSHYSYAIADAISSVNVKVIEVHLSNIYEREEFRNKSVTGKNALGVISGFGIFSYKMAMNYFKTYI